MRISELLGLNVSPFELDFVDVDIDHDYPLYIDPFLIANLNSQWAIRADQTIKNFFNEFKTAIINEDYEKAKGLFLYLSEPKENCLGVSKNGTTNGRGVGKLNTQKILDKILESNAIENNIVNNIEDLIIFVDDIDKDKLSDMVTNIIRKNLLEYTKQQCVLWGVPLTLGETLPYWDPVEREWVYSEDELLVIRGRELLLIPKAIVSPINVFKMSKYKWNFVVEQERNFHLQRRSALVRIKRLKNGKLKYYLPKKDVDQDINNQINNGIYRSTKDFLRQYTLRSPELFVHFVESSKRIIKSLSNEELVKLISEISMDEILNGLINKLKNIPTGKDHASEYHHFIKMVLEILWYPYLINPIIEREIHEGRKRIDIVMDNNAKEGFFYNMHQVFKIFCPFIFIECKNYGRDVANPEIDQLSGRFSATRGQFGILMCRSIQDETLLLKRCQDTYKDGRGLIFYLTDEDIITMLESIRDERPHELWELLDAKRRNVILA